MLLWRDARCVVVDKPAGVATHRGWADDDDEPLLQRVRDLVGQHVYPVHRLDRGASGAILFALDRASAGAFAAAWPSAEKTYLALTRGHPPEQLVIGPGTHPRVKEWETLMASFQQPLPHAEQTAWQPMESVFRLSEQI